MAANSLKAEFTADYKNAQKLLAENQFTQAINILHDLAQRAHMPELWQELGNLYYSYAMFSEAATAFGHAYQLKPDAEILLLLAKTQLKLKNYAHVIELSQAAKNLNPQNLTSDIFIAESLYYLGNSADAESLLKSVLQDKPTAEEQYFANQKYGNILLDLGRTDEAIENFDAALEYNKSNYAMLQAKFLAKKLTANDLPIIQSYEDEAKKLKSIKPGNENLFFALGKAYDDLKNYTLAAKYYERANEILNSRQKFDNARLKEFTANSAKVFTQEFFSARKYFGSDSEKPIFILGMPRSATTLIERIISSHSQVAAAGELQTISQLGIITPQFLQSPEPYPLCLERMNAEQCAHLANSYLDVVNKIGPQALRVTDKMPYNFEHIGFIALCFPHAKIIHTIRDPRDVALSIYFNHFTSAHEWAQDFASIAAYYEHYLQMMQHWKNVLPGRIIDIHYDDLVNDTEATSRKLIEIAGLKWEDSCLEFYKQQSAVKTASKAQVNQPVYKSSLGKWAAYEPFFGDEFQKLINIAQKYKALD